MPCGIYADVAGFTRSRRLQRRTPGMSGFYIRAEP